MSVAFMAGVARLPDILFIPAFSPSERHPLQQWKLSHISCPLWLVARPPHPLPVGNLCRSRPRRCFPLRRRRLPTWPLRLPRTPSKLYRSFQDPSRTCFRTQSRRAVPLRPPTKRVCRSQARRGRPRLRQSWTHAPIDLLAPTKP